ncbi:MAG TPA: sodium-dependent transporter, partial [Halanaerobiales bacterium]|nr:sodium-dependent transporter [Halanaerobiales bacterium]
IVEAGVAALKDKWGGTKRTVTLFYSIFLFVVGLLFATKGGLYWLDIVDHYVNTYGLVVAGLAESVIIGWYYDPNELRGYFNSVSEYQFGSWWNVMIKYVTPIMLVVLLVNEFIADIGTQYGGYELRYLIYGGWAGVIGLLLVASFILSRQRGLDDAEI